MANKKAQKLFLIKTLKSELGQFFCLLKLHIDTFFTKKAVRHPTGGVLLLRITERLK